MFNFLENLKRELIIEIKDEIMKEIKCDKMEEKRDIFDIEKRVSKDTDILFIIDRSGSMNCIRKETINSYNNFLREEFKKEGNTYITTVLFNDDMETINLREKIENVDDMSKLDYVPNGCTALMDAIGKSIKGMEEKIDNGNKVIVVIITDGEENASTTYNKRKVRELIKKHNDWEFVFLGANIDSFEEGESLGIDSKRIANFKQEERSVGKLFKCVKRLYDEEEFDLQEEMDS